MSRVAIIGSCVTRDLWPVLGDLPGLLYISRTSLPSLMSTPVPGFRASASCPPGLTRYQHRAVVDDLTKRALPALLAFRPTHIVLDFIDERFDLLAFGDSLATHSWELETAGHLRQAALAHARPIPRLSGACDQLWRAAAREFAALLRGTALRDAVLILHETQWARTAIDSGRRTSLTGVEIWPGRPADLSAHNALLADYQATFLDAAPWCIRVAAPRRRIADARHRWGLSPFHYVPAYYREIWRRLSALGIEPPIISAGSAPPSARGA